MKTVATLLVLVSLAIFVIEGRPGIGIQRCLCHGAGLEAVRPKLIEKVEIHPVSPTCGHLEVVVTLKNGAGRRCLNPESRFTKYIIESLAKKTRSAQ
ncbi:C-X-C motif chemokine 11-1-like [Carassius auratus]|uniref:C-X-C motif chemokine 11-1-like n=1 Tax=Carassius auratus TaxID=7957 RepID=A0A6P6MMV1_CARAU|nr:C-X-C motif chemokine 11-1-like [Carassius auratus]XP_052446339.1 C-X-C motif chemokine 11-1 [Carassius gibelio]